MPTKLHQIVTHIINKELNKAKTLIHESMNEKLGILLEEKLLEYAPTIMESHENIRSSPTDRAASDVHDAWMTRNPKEDYNAHQHVPYENLSPEEQEKDKEHISIIHELQKPVESSTGRMLQPQRHEIVDGFGKIAHEKWRNGFEASKGVGTPRMKSTSDGQSVNINVPWAELHPDYKKENLAAGEAALTAYETHIRPKWKYDSAKDTDPTGEGAEALR